MAQQTNTNREPFKYDALPDSSHIRLLERLGYSNDGILRLGLIVRPIDAPGPDYHCISYTWGNPFAHGNQFRSHYDSVADQYKPEQGIPILVNERVLYIGKSLHDALRQLPQNAYVDYVNRAIDGREGQSYLQIAAAEGRAPHVEIWLCCGSRVDRVDIHGQTALHLAARSGHVECVKVLLRYGASKAIVDKNGSTALELAYIVGNNGVIALLDGSEAHSTPLQSRLPPVLPDKFHWADAICINQNDVEEKTAQVNMMDRIFSAATYVTAWLGPADSHTEAGIHTLNTLFTHLPEFQDSQIEPFGGTDKDAYEHGRVPFISWPEWISLASIYQRQWFRRAWIAQEAILPTVLLIYIGDHALSWTQLGQVAEALRRNEAKLGSGSSSSFAPAHDVAVPVEWNMAEVYKWRTKKGEANQKNIEKAAVFKSHFTIRELVFNFWTFLATDPRDKIFAFYGLYNLFAQQRLNANYRTSMSQVYTSATRTLIDQDGNLEILSACVYPTQRSADLPSWVPDFSLPGINSVPGTYSADAGIEYQPIDNKTSAPASLSLRGVQIGTISEVSGRRGTGPSEKLLFDESWLRMTLSLLPSKGSRMSLSETLWRTLCMNRSYGSLFDSGIFGTGAPDELGGQFRMLLLLMILSEGDYKIRQHLDLAPSPRADIIFSHDGYDPMIQDMEPTLALLEQIATNDGQDCYTPTRTEVLHFWNELKCSLVRNTAVNADGGPHDYYVRPEVQVGKSRVVGSGFVNMNSRMARSSTGFTRAFSMVYGGRQLVTVDSTYLGLASLSVQRKDQVWILPGLKAPAILRPIGGENTRFRFAGSCYIHGLMHGEATEDRATTLVDLELE